MSKTSSKTSTPEVHTVTALAATGDDAVPASLTPTQRRSRDAAVKAYERGMTRSLAGALEAGAAWRRIRDEGLWVEDADSPEDFCLTMWGHGREYPDTLARMVEVVEAIKPAGLPLPPSQRAVKALAPLRDDPARLATVWGEVVEQHGEHPTEDQVTEAVRAVKPSTRASNGRTRGGKRGTGAGAPAPADPPTVDLYGHLTNALGAIESDPAAVEDPAVLRVLGTLSRVLVAARDHDAEAVLTAIHADPTALDTDQ